ncbi:MAG: hypothetical protein CME75_07890 [Halomonas sp.]|nr:hypothetical protein [Halomonas sp.]
MNTKLTIWESEKNCREISLDAAKGETRLCITYVFPPEQDQGPLYMGADLTPSECRQLAHLLNAAALSAEQEK